MHSNNRYNTKYMYIVTQQFVMDGYGEFTGCVFIVCILSEFPGPPLFFFAMNLTEAASQLHSEHNSYHSGFKDTKIIHFSSANLKGIECNTLLRATVVVIHRRVTCP